MRIVTTLVTTVALAALAACTSNNANNAAYENADLNAGMTETNTITEMNTTTEMNATGNMILNETGTNTAAGNTSYNNTM
jgi:hypothetical protein